VDNLFGIQDVVVNKPRKSAQRRFVADSSPIRSGFGPSINKARLNQPVFG
jgi:hypothetical protein